MALLEEVQNDLKAENGDRAKLMQKYSDRMKELLIPHGGNLSDLPMDPNHEYHKLQRKLMALGKLL